VSSFTRAVEKACTDLGTQKRKTKTEKNAARRRRQKDKKTSAGALRVQAAVEEFLATVGMVQETIADAVEASGEQPAAIEAAIAATGGTDASER
jgi:hypothetical protein